MEKELFVEIDALVDDAAELAAEAVCACGCGMTCNCIIGPLPESPVLT